MADSPLPSNVTPDQSGAVPQSPESAWNAASNQAAPETPATPATPPAEAPVQTTVGGGNKGGKPSIGKIFLVILVFMVLFAVGFAGAVGVSMLLNRDNQAADENPAQSQTPSPTPDPTADWTEYEKGAYVFKLPSHFINNDEVDLDTTASFTSNQYSNLGFSLTLNMAGIGLECVETLSESTTNISGREVMISIMQGVQDSDLCAEDTSSTMTHMVNLKPDEERGDIVIFRNDVSQLAQEDAEEMFNQIMSTFEIKSEAGETENASPSGELSPAPEAE